MLAVARSVARPVFQVFPRVSGLGVHLEVVLASRAQDLKALLASSAPGPKAVLRLGRS